MKVQNNAHKCQVKFTVVAADWVKDKGSPRLGKTLPIVLRGPTDIFNHSAHVQLQYMITC